MEKCSKSLTRLFGLTSGFIRMTLSPICSDDKKMTVLSAAKNTQHQITSRFMFITCLRVCLGATERGRTSLCRTSYATLLSFCLNSLRQSQRGCWLWFLGLVLMDFCQAAITLNHPYYISAYSHWKEFLHIRRTSPWWFLNPPFLLLALGRKQWNIDKDIMEWVWTFPALFVSTISLCFSNQMGRTFFFYLFSIIYVSMSNVSSCQISVLPGSPNVVEFQIDGKACPQTKQQ